MTQFCFGIITGETLIRKHLLSWMRAAGGMISQEELELRIGQKARKNYGAASLECWIHPNHNALTESRRNDSFFGGLFYDLRICSPQEKQVAGFLEETLKGEPKTVAAITLAFYRNFDMIPAVLLVNDDSLKTRDPVLNLQARLVLTHQTDRRLIYKPANTLRPKQRSHLAFVERSKLP